MMMRCPSLKSKVWFGWLAAVSLLSFQCTSFSQEPETSLPRLATWRLSNATLTLPGIPASDFKANVRLGGEYWSYYANVRITEALPGKPQTWLIVKGYKPGTWGTYSAGRITYSTWGPSLAAFAKMSPIEKTQHIRALAHHEMGHGLGCPGWCQTPTQQRAWLVQRYGPPAVKGAVPEEIQPLPPRPKPGWLYPLKADRVTVDAGAREKDRPGLLRWRERGPLKRNY